MVTPLEELTVVGADGVLKVLALASTVMYAVEAIESVLFGDVQVAVTLAPEPRVICTRTFCEAGAGAFWWGFHRDGKSQASNVIVPDFFFQYGLKTILLRYGRFLIPASS
jgi:hypothetical protein